MPMVNWTTANIQELESLRRALDKTPRPIVASASEYSDQHCIAWHTHERCQLVYASKGTAVVKTEIGTWVAPPQRGVWVPAGVRHEIRMSGHVRMCSLYIDKEIAPNLSTDRQLITVFPLIRELILHAMRIPILYDVNGPDGRFMDVIMDSVRDLPSEPLFLPTAQSRRLRRITEVLIEKPGDARTLSDWGKFAGGSERTIARAFIKETGLTFAQWRQRVRLLKAISLLAQKLPVSIVAEETGFRNDSAFIAMFKKVTGKTPGKYFKSNQNRG